MADYSGPWMPEFDVNGDVVPGTGEWAVDQWYDHMPAAMPSGVIGARPAGYGSGDLALTLTGLNWTIGTGKANVGGSGFKRDSAAGAAITANSHATWARRDRLVLRRSRTSEETTVVRIQGTAAASPSAPAITRDDTTFDLKLFSFLVPANNGTTISGVVDERVWIDDGTVTGPGEGTMALLHGTGSQTISSGGSHKAVTLGAEEYAVGFDVDTATGKLTAQYPGRYLVSGGVAYATTGASGSGRRIASILKNGTVELRTQNRSDPDTGNTVSIATAAYPFALSAGDYIQLGTYQDAGVDQTVSKSQCFLQAYYIGQL